MVCKFIREDIANTVLSQYRDRSDAAHRDDHIKKVILNAQKMCDIFGVEYNLEIELACLFHDIGLAYYKDNRENHHITSADVFLIYYQKMGIELSIDQVHTIVGCILKHRASTKCERNAMERIVWAADRGFPNTTKEDVYNNMVMRSVSYYISKYGMKRDDAHRKAYDHLLGKYDTYVGYAYDSYPEEYMKMFADELEVQSFILNDLASEKYICSNN